MIYFVRHGQTNLNQQKIFQGHIDEPLNELGLIQAKGVAEQLKDEKFDLNLIDLESELAWDSIRIATPGKQLLKNEYKRLMNKA